MITTCEIIRLQACTFFLLVLSNHLHRIYVKSIIFNMSLYSLNEHLIRYFAETPWFYIWWTQFYISDFGWGVEDLAPLSTGQYIPQF